MVKIVANESYRFNIDTEQEAMLKYMDDNGYAVIKEVANYDEILLGVDFLWDFIHSYPESTMLRGKPDTWTIDHWIADPGRGLLNNYGMGQSNFMWHTRLLPRVKKTFQAIWNTPDLLTSFDGGCIFRPWQINRDWLTRESWWHTDQNGYHESGQGKRCVQGLVTYCDANIDSGGLCVIVGSHKEHTKYCRRNPLAYMEGDFLKVPPEDPVLQACDEEDGQFEARLICCKAGDMIIWDSRTVHCNGRGLTAASAERADPPNLLHATTREPSTSAMNSHNKEEVPLLRIVAYVCMTPLAWASPEVLASRRLAFVHNESTSHWPHKFMSGGRASSYYLPKRNVYVDRSPRSSQCTSGAQSQALRRFQPDPNARISPLQRDLIDGKGSRSGDDVGDLYADYCVLS